MSIENATALIALSGTRQADGSLLIDGDVLDGFPDTINIDGTEFDFSDEEEVDAETRRCLGHYFRRDEAG